MDMLYASLVLLVTTWALLMMFSSLAYASMNFIDEWLLVRLGEQCEKPVGTLVMISGSFGIVIAVVFGTIAAFDSETTLFVGNGLEFQAMAVGMLEVAWLTPYLYATHRSGAIEAAPLFQSVPVIALLIGLFAFAEVPPAIHIAGSIAIVGGGALLNIVPGTFRLDGRTVGLMLLASTIIALIYHLFKDAALGGNFVATAFWGGVGMCVATLLIFTFWRPYRRQFVEFCRAADKKALLVQLGSETVNATAVLASQLAMTLGPSVMAVSALTAYQPVFILIIGLVLAKCGSKKHAQKLAGKELVKKTIAILLIAGGTVFITQ